MAQFDPRPHLRPMKGNSEYLDCKWRVVWFRLENPDGQIETEIVHMDRDKREVVFKATVRVPSTGAYATGYCEGDAVGFKFGYIEKCETQAIGRALALLGYGTQFSTELDTEDGDKLADSPVERTVVSVVSEEVAKAQLSAEIRDLLAHDDEATSKLPKKVIDMNLPELQKTRNWLTNRANRG